MASSWALPAAVLAEFVHALPPGPLTCQGPAGGSLTVRAGGHQAIFLGAPVADFPPGVALAGPRLVTLPGALLATLIPRTASAAADVKGRPIFGCVLVH